MAKWLILILIVLLAQTVYADKGLIEVYKPDVIFDLSLHLTNSTGDVTGATCNIQIRNETFLVLEDSVMNEIGGGWYNFTYNTSTTGKYLCRQNCTLGTLFTAETCDFVIDEGFNVILAIIVILVIAFILLILGLWQRDWNFGFASGFLFSVIGIYILTTGLPQFINWVSDSLGFILIGFGAYVLFRASVDSLNEADQ